MSIFQLQPHEPRDRNLPKPWPKMPILARCCNMNSCHTTSPGGDTWYLILWLPFKNLQWHHCVLALLWCANVWTNWNCWSWDTTKAPKPNVPSLEGSLVHKMCFWLNAYIFHNEVFGDTSIPGFLNTQPFGIPCAHFNGKTQDRFRFWILQVTQDWFFAVFKVTPEWNSFNNKWELSFQQIGTPFQKIGNIPKATTATKQQVHGGFCDGPIRNHTELVEERNGTIDLATHSGWRVYPAWKEAETIETHWGKRHLSNSNHWNFQGILRICSFNKGIVVVIVVVRLARWKNAQNANAYMAPSTCATGNSICWHPILLRLFLLAL